MLLKKSGTVSNNKIIHVIKEKKNFWDNNQRYFYTNIKNKPFIYGFLNMKAAENCKMFLETYKITNNRYPEEYQFNMNSISIDDEPLNSMVHRCSLSGVGLIGIIDFKVNYNKDYYMDYKAIDLLENIDIKDSEIIDNLEYIYDCF
jgi:hypothetical protein